MPRRFPRLSWLDWLLVAFCATVLAAMAIPNFVDRHPTGSLNAIGNNLRLIEGAKEQWALDNRKLLEAPVALSDLTAYFKNSRVPASVAGETYQVTTVGELAQALMKGEINGHRGPFTTSSF